MRVLWAQDYATLDCISGLIKGRLRMKPNLRSAQMGFPGRELNAFLMLSRLTCAVGMTKPVGT
jgi:hypothetical protein